MSRWTLGKSPRRSRRASWESLFWPIWHQQTPRKKHANLFTEQFLNFSHNSTKWKVALILSGAKKKNIQVIWKLTMHFLIGKNLQGFVEYALKISTVSCIELRLGPHPNLLVVMHFAAFFLYLSCHFHHSRKEKERFL